MKENKDMALYVLIGFLVLLTLGVIGTHYMLEKKKVEILKKEILKEIHEKQSEVPSMRLYR